MSFRGESVEGWEGRMDPGESLLSSTPNLAGWTFRDQLRVPPRSSAPIPPPRAESSDPGVYGFAKRDPKTLAERIRERIAQSKPAFRMTAFAKEPHDGPLYGVDIFHGPGPLGRLAATCGRRNVTIYELFDDPHPGVDAIQIYVDDDAGYDDEPSYDRGEEFCCLRWGFDPATGEGLCAVGGKRGVIKVLAPSRHELACELRGHGGGVNDLVFHPVDPHLLISASKDGSARIWNLATGLCAVTFTGDGGHSDEVLSVAVHPLGWCLASAGMDNTVRLWGLDDPTVARALASSHLRGPRPMVSCPPTVVQESAFVTGAVHGDYIDSITFAGNFLVTKSSDAHHLVILWAPDTAPDGGWAWGPLSPPWTSAFKATPGSLIGKEEQDEKEDDLALVKEDTKPASAAAAAGSSSSKPLSSFESYSSGKGDGSKKPPPTSSKRRAMDVEDASDDDDEEEDSVIFVTSSSGDDVADRNGTSDKPIEVSQDDDEPIELSSSSDARASTGQGQAEADESKMNEAGDSVLLSQDQEAQTHAEELDPSAGAVHVEGTLGNVTVIQPFKLDDSSLWFMRLAASPDGTVIAAGSDTGSIYLWATDRKALKPGAEPADELVLLTHPKCSRPVRLVAFSHDGSTLCAVSDDSVLWRWDLTQDK